MSQKGPKGVLDELMESNMSDNDESDDSMPPLVPKNENPRYKL